MTASFLGAPVLFVEGSRRAAAASGTRAPNGYERRAPSGLRVKALRSGLLSAEFHLWTAEHPRTRLIWQFDTNRFHDFVFISPRCLPSYRGVSHSRRFTRVKPIFLPGRLRSVHNKTCGISLISSRRSRGGAVMTHPFCRLAASA